MRPTPRHVVLVFLMVALVGTSATLAGGASATTYERIAAELSLRLSVSVGVPKTSLLVSGRASVPASEWTSLPAPDPRER